MNEIIKFDGISFVSDEEVMNSKEYKEMFEEVKENLNTRKIKEIVNNIEKISIEDTIIYKVKNDTEFTALQKYYWKHEMRFQDGWIEDFTYGFMILLDNSIDDFIWVYSGSEVLDFESNVQNLLNFLKKGM